MDNRATKVQAKSYPSNAGTKQLGPAGLYTRRSSRQSPRARLDPVYSRKGMLRCLSRSHNRELSASLSAEATTADHSSASTSCCASSTELLATTRAPAPSKTCTISNVMGLHSRRQEWCALQVGKPCDTFVRGKRVLLEAGQPVCVWLQNVPSIDQSLNAQQA